MVLLPCLYLFVGVTRTAPVAREAIKLAYSCADLAAARGDIPGMYAIDASDFTEFYERQWRSREGRRSETEIFFRLRPLLKQRTAIRQIIAHGTRAVVIARRYQDYTIGYGSVGAMPLETPNIQYIHARMETVAEDEWRKTGSEWLRVSSRPLSHKETFILSTIR